LGDIVLRVYEFVVSGASVKHGAVISSVGGLEVTEPLESAPRRRSDDDEGGERESECSEDSMDVHETHDSEEDNSDLAPSVDTDVDSDVGSPAASDGPDGSNGAVSREEDEHADPQPIAAGPVLLAPRMPAGHWKVWDHPWFYMTDTAGYTDIKMMIKGCWSTPLHMGAFSKSKAVTPAHFGDPAGNTVRARVVLRAWAVWRSRRHGWAMATPGRQRQLEKDLVELERDIRSLQSLAPSEPLLGSAAAHQRLVEWVPDLVIQILG
jgi:hypothetical protein